MVLSSLAGLSALRSLDLSVNKIAAEHLEAAPLAAPSLTALNLAGNHGLKALPASVAALTGLADLDLRGTILTVLPPGPYLGACLTATQVQAAQLQPRGGTCGAISHIEACTTQRD